MIDGAFFVGGVSHAFATCAIGEDGSGEEVALCDVKDSLLAVCIEEGLACLACFFDDGHDASAAFGVEVEATGFAVGHGHHVDSEVSGCVDVFEFAIAFGAGGESDAFLSEAVFDHDVGGLS